VAPQRQFLAQSLGLTQDFLSGPLVFPEACIAGARVQTF
jgi:hypothetical protein